MNRVTERLEHLTPEQRRAFELRLRQRGRPSPPLRIERRSATSPCVLSFAQERLWFVEQLHPGTSANHISGAVRLEGELSLEALTTSLNAIVHRHQVLRSSYHDDGGRPLQRVAAEARCDVAVVAAAGTGAEERLRDAHRIAVEETDRPFDLTVPPLLRAVVIEVGERDHVLLLVVHHIAADAWSVGVLGRELTAGYNAALAGRPFPLADLPIQYPDYAAWQIGRIDESAMAGDIEWWCRRLEGVASVELPADRPRPAVASAAGGRESRLIPRQVADGLSQLGQRHGATLFMTLLAAFKTLLARWTAHADIAVGSPVAGRNWREVEDLIGLFVNLIVVRTNVAPHARFVDLLAAVRASVSDALRRDEVPFEKVVDALGIERTLSAAPLTPVIFALQNVPTEAIALDGLQVSRFEFDRCTSRFDASVFVVPRADGLQTIVEYRRDLFEPESMRRLLASYARLLEAIVADPEQRVDRLPLVGDEERRLLTVDWNRTAVQRTGRACVHELFEACAMRDPAACAVKDDAREITYADLNRDANRLANHLRRLGVRRDTTAVLVFEPSIAFVQAMLAVVKAGAAYVPVDASLPHERLRHVIGDSGAVAVLTTEALRRSLPALTVPCVCVDDVQAGSDRDDRAPQDAARADEPAYVIYTSGSTGEPKGVEITHAGLANLVQWHVATYQMTAGDRATQVANLAFDASVWEIWPSLASGACVCIAPDDVRRSPAALWRWVERHRVTLMFLPTPTAELALQERIPEGLALRALLTGGDRLVSVPKGPLSFAVVNHYGPTESTVVSTAGLVRLDEPGPPSIGRPIDNLRAYVLDDELAPVPIGVVGELYIAGAGLARGYRSRRRLTAERFLPDPFGETGDRMYCTGDLARWKADGRLEFVGRRDQQVKLRGYRIELGEIEHVLLQHPCVTAAVVVVREVEARGAVLVGYVVGTGELAIETELRSFAKARLPDYMVPSAFVALDAIPLTANGKVDRRALPPPLVTARSREAVAPRNEVEEIVVEACAQVLGLRDVSIVDNFFALGGHSLLVMQLASRLERALAVDVPIRWIFQSDTLAELSQTLAAAMLEDDEKSV